MALNMPVFYKRTTSAIVFAAIMLVGLLGDILLFYGLFTLISVLCLREYFLLMQKIDKSAHWPKWLPLSIVVIDVAIIACSILMRFGTIGGYNSAFACLFLATSLSVIFVISVLSKQNSLSAVVQGTAGLLYITTPMLAIIAMRWHSIELPIALILMIWTNDTMAYLVGSFIGKTPFSPISPKKTWEGTGGGALLTMIGAMAYGYFSHKFRLVDWAVLGLCAAVAGTLGDLAESKLKRMADVKDSGNIMPGHGGALDRFDSLLLAAPFAGCYVMLFM